MNVMQLPQSDITSSVTNGDASTGTSFSSTREIKNSSGESTSNNLWLEIIGRRKSLLATALLIGLIAGAAYYYLTPPTYQSSSRLLVMTSNSADMAMHSNGQSEMVSQDLLATHMSLIQSPVIVSNALADADLLECDSLKAEADPDDSTVDYVVKNLYVTQGGSGGARSAHTLKVAFRHADPQDCLVVVNAVVDQYQKFVTEKFKDINEEAVDLIERARKDLENQIAETAEEYKKFRLESPILSQEGSSNAQDSLLQLLASEISDVSVEIDRVGGRLELVKSELQRLGQSEINALQKLALIDEVNAARLGVLVTVERGETQTAAFQALMPERAAGAQVEYATLLELRAKLTQAKEDFGANHSTVRALELRVAEMEGFLKKRQASLSIGDQAYQLTPDDIMTAYVSLMESDLQALIKRKEDLLKRQEAAEIECKKLVSFELEQRELEAKLERQEELYESVVTRLRDINMKKEATTLILEEIEEPTVGRKISPSFHISGVVGLLTALLIGGLTVAFAELRDNRIRSVEEIESIYGAKVLGLVPDLKNTAMYRDIVRKARSSKSPVVPENFVFHAPQEPISELIRGIRTQILFGLGSDQNVLCVTSANQADGKSTIVANLAVSIASAGKSVLLVDCDMRRPNVFRQFGVKPEPGLADVLQGSKSLTDAVQDASIERLSMIAAGRCDNPAELLARDEFSNFLKSVRKKYDLIILDCPPMLPVSDPAIIAPHSDGVLVVAHLGGQSGPQSKHCRRILEAANANIVGVIINRSEVKAAGYYGNYTGYYKYMSSKTS